MENTGDSGGMNHSSDGEIPEGLEGELQIQNTQ